MFESDLISKLRKFLENNSLDVILISIVISSFILSDLKLSHFMIWLMFFVSSFFGFLMIFSSIFGGEISISSKGLLPRIQEWLKNRNKN